MPKARPSTNASPNTYGQLLWQARELIATLIFEGNTVGRHYAGPHWEHMDGSVVRAKAVGTTPGKTINDLPWLKLDVISLKRQGVFFSGATTCVQRVNTQGGVTQGSCEEPGSFLGIPDRRTMSFCAWINPKRSFCVGARPLASKLVLH